jgi:hypothetical protein
MSESWQSDECHVLELLADREAFGLEREKDEELRHLLQNRPDLDSECMERVAAMVQLALTPIEPLPAGVRAKILESGIQHIRGCSQEQELDHGAGLS